MTTPPQAVTERYVSNLISYGRNREFDIVYVNRDEYKEQNYVVAIFFNVAIMQVNKPASDPTQILGASAATISLAVRRALERHGVTFR